MNKQFQILNSVYKPLWGKAQSVLKELRMCGFDADCAFYNGHFIKSADGWEEEYFPIPVISVKGLCDIEFDLVHTGITAKLKKDGALKFDYGLLCGKKFEMYGVENYLDDIFNEDIPADKICENIQKSGEKEIGFSFVYKDEVLKEELLTFIRFLKANGFYY